MKAFEPSEKFVETTMTKIFDSERYNKKKSPMTTFPLLITIGQSALSAGGVILGIVNIVKLYSMVFANVACH